MQANLKRAVERFSKNITFLIPLFEAIANALDAHARHINVVFSQEPDALLTNEEDNPKIFEYSVEDDGDGFTDKNRKAFSELYTENKADIGGKGLGRLAGLCIFEKVIITSETGEEKVELTFDQNFKDENDFHCTSYKTQRRRTVVSFKCPRPTKDKLKHEMNLEQLKEIVQSHFLIRLFLLREAQEVVSIRLSIEGKGETLEITTETLPQLNKQEFEIPPCKDKFKLYSGFISNVGQKSKTMFYCANGRTVCPIDSMIELAKHLPEQQSMLLLLCGKYLDEMVNDARTGFDLPQKQSHQISLFPALSLDQLEGGILPEVQKIIKARFPKLEERNSEEIKNAIDEAPYLAEYIRNDKSIIKNRKNLLEEARKAFASEKVSAKTRFDKLLKKKKVEPKAFLDAVRAVSAVAFAELGEYVLYRQSIINAFEQSSYDVTKKEEFLHDLLMEMKTESCVTDSVEVSKSNLWLLDDRFMTYTYAASDKTINQIRKTLGANTEAFKIKDRPDLFLLFSREQDMTGDAIVIELKGSNASHDEKEKALVELPKNIGLLRKNFPRIRRIWGYIITKIDENLNTVLGYSDYKTIFQSGDQNKRLAFHKYHENIDADVTVLDVKTVAADANARNKTFLDILKKPYFEDKKTECL